MTPREYLNQAEMMCNQLGELIGEVYDKADSKVEPIVFQALVMLAAKLAVRRYKMTRQGQRSDDQLLNVIKLGQGLLATTVMMELED